MEIENARGTRSIRITAREVREIYDLRILLECDCLQRAARAMTAAELREIDSIQVRPECAAPDPHWAANDWAFHRSIYQFAGRHRQLTMIEALRRLCSICVGHYSSMSGTSTRWLDEHRLILHHLKRGEAELAVAILRNHLEGAAQHLLDGMNISPDE